MTRDAGNLVPSDGYEGVDALEEFESRAELEKVREGSLVKARLETAFIAREIGGSNLRVLDLGTGNGRVLIALGSEGFARSGVGVDTARSRIAFASRWAADLGLDGLKFYTGNVLEPAAWLRGEFDLIAALSNLLGYLPPIRPDASEQLLKMLYRHLSPTGCMLLEFYQLTPDRRQILALSGNRFRTWMPLPTWDRFAYYLSDFSFDPTSGVLDHAKTFIGRDGSIDAGSMERTAFHTFDEVLGWLRTEGCSAHRVYGSFASDPFDPVHSTQVILLAGGPQWVPSSEEHRAAYAGDTPRERRPDGPGAWVWG